MSITAFQKFSVGPRLTAAWILFLVLSLFQGLPVKGADTEAQYVRIYYTILDADTLAKNGQTAAAVTKYQQAQRALEDYQKYNPGVYNKAVSYRLAYVTEKIKAASNAQAAPEAEATQTAAGGSPDASKSKVKLLEPGADPKKALRMHPKAGDKQTVSFGLKISMETKMGEMAMPAMNLPTMNMTMDTTVKSVAQNGDITYDLVMSDVSISEEPGLMAQVAEAMKASLGAAKGMTGSGVVTDHGVTKRYELKLPANADPQLHQAMDQAKEMFANLILPLPAEPVGTGAKWESTAPIKSQGMTIQQTTTCELTGAQDDQITAQVTIAQEASNQKISNPAMPGMKMDLKKMSGTGKGERTWDLTKIFPSKSNSDGEAETTMAINAGGNTQTIEAKMTIKAQAEAK